MKRREYGINLDDGVALLTNDEFRLLYVPCNPDVTDAVQQWFKSESKEPLLLGGQIGSGKTTLLKEVARSFKTITVSFDTDPLEPTESGYSLLLFGKIIQTCLATGVEVDGCGVLLSDFPSLATASWNVFSKKATSRPSSLQEAELLQEVCTVIAENNGLVLKSCGKLLDRLCKATSREPIILAEGVDKLRLGTSDYFSLKAILHFLAHRKTLFEVNAVHLFQEQDFVGGIRKEFVGRIDDASLVKMLKKRLGSYAPAYHEVFSLIVSYSGGNARQALRILSAYYFQCTQQKKGHTAAFAMACQKVGNDTLSISYRNFPVDIFTVVKRDGYIEGSLFSSQDKMVSEGANDTVYNNWLFIQNEPTPSAPTQWSAIVNPLIDAAINWSPSASRTPEEEAVRAWASDHDISPIGLNIPINENGEPEWKKFWEELESSFEDEALNIVGLLEEIGAGLFGVERQDRIIITYEDRKCVEAVRDFLVGEANTYVTFPCEEITLVGGEGETPIVKLMVRLSEKDPNRIYSIELTGKWTDTQLRDLDHRRDLFGDLQMLWWVQTEDLKRYLRFWPQLRQLFRIYQLEEDLWQGITAEQIAADIEFINEISENSNTEGTRRLSSVLAYLEKKGGES